MLFAAGAIQRTHAYDDRERRSNLSIRLALSRPDLGRNVTAAARGSDDRRSRSERLVRFLKSEMLCGLMPPLKQGMPGPGRMQ